jgi:hypothetical protein
MQTNAKIFLVPVGRPGKNVKVKVCKAGYAKLQAHAASLQYKKAEGIRKDHHPLNFDPLRIKRTPYVFARFTDRATGKTTRPELGRWLLNSQLPVSHINDEPLDFRLENLVAQETDKQKRIHEQAALKRAASEARKARWAEKRAADWARRPRKGPDGLTPAEKEAELCSAKFQRTLCRMAKTYIALNMHKLGSKQITDAPDVVNEVTTECLRRVREGRIDNIRAYAFFSVRTQAKNPRKEWLREIKRFGTQT